MRKRYFAIGPLLMASLVGCVQVPVRPVVEDDPNLVELARAAALSANANRVLAEVAVAQSGPAIKTEVLQSLQNQPEDGDLITPVKLDFAGPAGAAVRALAGKIGWRYEERGNPERVQVVQLAGTMTVVSAMRSLSDQMPWNLTADEKTHTLVLDYTRQAALHRNEQNIPATLHATSSKWFIQAGVYGHQYEKTAKAVTRRLQKKGLRAISVNDGSMFYVFVGPFASQDQARDVIGSGKVRGHVIEKAGL